MHSEITSTIPVNLYHPNNPLIGRCVANEKIIHEGTLGSVHHIVLDLSDPNFRYLEGQSIGIIPPGTDSDGRPYKLGLYSIASTRHGDYIDDRTVSLCVSSLEYSYLDINRRLDAIDCSNYLCNLQPGEEVKITGPVGSSFLLPNDPNATIIMMATGTGIAPFRAFLWQMFANNYADYKFNGFAWLFLSASTIDDILYKDELYHFQELAEGNLHIDYAIGNEQENVEGGKIHIQDLVVRNAARLWHMLQQDNTYTYLCGMKTVKKDIDKTFNQFLKTRGVDWHVYQKRLKRLGRWCVALG